MSIKDQGYQNKEYLLGSRPKELNRLGVQHNIWARDAHEGWNAAGFRKGDSILDIGCGPGFCSTELGYRVGQEGEVIGIELSDIYIDFLRATTERHDINFNLNQGDLHDSSIYPQGIDGTWCRWVMAWVADPKAVVQHMYHSLKSSGRMVFHEYYDWECMQFTPHRPSIQKGLQAAFRSFEDSHGYMNIGAKLPEILANLGMKIVRTRIMTKLVRPTDFEWSWPFDFLTDYFVQLVEMGYLTQDESQHAVQDIHELGKLSYANCMCPPVIEIIAEK